MAAARRYCSGFRHALFQTRVKLLSEFLPKFRELARPDSLPDASQSVKEEHQIVVRQKNTGEHLAREIQMANKCARVPPTNRTRTRFVKRTRVGRKPGIFDVQLSP